MEAGIPIQVLLPLVIAAISLGIGMGLRLVDFAALLSSSRAAIAGLLCMFLLFPLLAFAIAWLLPLPPAIAVGLVLLASSPSGSTSTLFTHLARGDVALSLALTAASKFIPVFTIPLYVSLAAGWFTDTRTSFSLSLADTSERMALMVLLPTCIGMVLRWRFPAATARARPLVMRLAVTALALLILALIYRERHNLPNMLLAAGPAALALGVLGMTLAYGIATWLRLPASQRSAITLEVCIQSGGTAIAIAAGVLAAPALAVSAAVYSLLMYLLAIAFVYWQRKTAAGIPVSG
jgi:BASS family bile acid:Na+ symporter